MDDKKYIHPAQKRQAEHEKRKEKKKKKRGLLWLLLLLLLIALLIGGIGFGQGWFDGKGENEGDGKSTTSSADTSSQDQTSSVDESSEAAKESVKVEISGSSYTFKGAEKTLEELKTELAALDKSKVIVEIADSDAVANAVSTLHDVLDELGIAYTDTAAATPESSSEAAS
ncbi:MAG: hypothetical protein IKP47_04925 [Ruminococcus sp.]|nr:hypothetical protein [Ruminococcus sp.]